MMFNFKWTNNAFFQKQKLIFWLNLQGIYFDE